MESVGRERDTIVAQAASWRGALGESQCGGILSTKGARDRKSATARADCGGEGSKPSPRSQLTKI